MATTNEFPSRFTQYTRRKMRMGADFKALKGTIACVALSGGSKGCVVEGADAAGLLSIGRFGETVDNTGGAAGAKTVEVLFHRQFEAVYMANDATDPVAISDIGQLCYVADNNTVSIEGADRSVAGVVWDLVDGLVAYEVIPVESLVAALIAAAAP